MILANVAAAETLERASVPLIYRVHDEPSLEKVEGLRDLLRTLDMSFPKGAVLRPALFNSVLQQVKDTETETLVNEVVLRSQAQAEYSAENYGHFGLALRRYAHFTSPIRRYADLIVHRALIRALKSGDGALPDADGHQEPERDFRPYFSGRTARHGGRARDQRPADRASSGRPGRRHLRGTDRRVSRAPGCS